MGFREYEARVQLVIDGGPTFRQALDRGDQAARDLRKRVKDNLEGVKIRREPGLEWRLGNPFDDWKPRARNATVPLLVVFAVGVEGSDGRESNWQSRHGRVTEQLRVEAGKLTHAVRGVSAKVNVRRREPAEPLAVEWL